MPLSAPHLLVSIEAAFLIETPRFLWALSIHQDQTGSRLAPLSVANLAGERGDDGLPDALFPSAKSVVDGALCGEVVGKIVPLDAGLVDVNEGIDDLAQWDGGGSSSRRWWGQHGFEQGPLLIGEIARICSPVALVGILRHLALQLSGTRSIPHPLRLFLFP